MGFLFQHPSYQLHPHPHRLAIHVALRVNGGERERRQVRADLAAFSLTAVDPERDVDGKTVRMGMELIRGVLK